MRTLCNRDAQRLLIALRAVDEHESIELPGKVRLAMGININKLMPTMVAYERALQRTQMRMVSTTTETEALTRAAAIANQKITDELNAMSDATAKYDLRDIQLSALSLDSNKRITGDRIASLAPILTGLDAPA